MVMMPLQQTATAFAVRSHAQPQSQSSTKYTFKSIPLSLSKYTDNTDKESEAASDISTLFASQSLSLWSMHRQFERCEKFTSGDNAIIAVAGNMSENIFLYPLLEDSNTHAINADKLRARVITLEVRAGAADAIRGTLAADTSASAFVPSQTLPMFLPNMFAIAQSQKNAVFHIACESIRSDLAVGSSYESIYALQHSGCLLLNSSTPQECHDMSVIAHVAALRLKKLLVHFYDATRVSKELSKLSILTQGALKSITAIEVNSASISASEQSFDVAEQVQYVMDDLFHVLQKQYKVYEYFGAPDAEKVVVVVGEATTALKEAVTYEQMLGQKVGLVQVRLLLPWSNSLFAATLPSCVKRIAVLENVSPSAFAFQNGLLTQNVQAFIHSNYFKSSIKHTFKPTVVTGIHGGVFQNAGFSVGMGRAVFDHLDQFTSRRSFILAKSEDKYDAALEIATTFPNLDVVYGADFELPNEDSFAKEFLIWTGSNTSAPDLSASTLLTALNRNRSTQVNALIRNSTATISNDPSIREPVLTTEIRISPAGSQANDLTHVLEEADVCIVEKVSLLEMYDLPASVKQGGRILVHTNWNSKDDLPDEGYSRFKAAVANRDLQLYVVDIDALKADENDVELERFVSDIAFFKAAALYPQNVVTALLQSQVIKEKHEQLRRLVAAVWSSVHKIQYPTDEWAAEGKLAELDATLEVETVPFPSMGAICPSKIAHTEKSLAIANNECSGSLGKRPRITPSADTKIAWKFLFPEAFKVKHDVREHVEDIVTVTHWERLTPEAYDRNVFHIEMDTTGTKIKYRIGEALAVFAHNDWRDVLKFLELYNTKPEDLVTIPVPHKAKAGVVSTPMEETMTYFQLFSHVLDIFGRPSKKFYQALLEATTDPKEKEELTHLLSDEGKDAYKELLDETTTYSDLLQMFPVAKKNIPLKKLATLVARIKPRHYSIASSMKMNPNSVHLLIVVHDWTTPKGKYRIGQATRFLSGIGVGQKLSVHVCSSVMKLPKNHMDPIIMAGLGTGMAPFRAFIQERAFLKSKGIPVGPIALYFGSRNKANEYLYGDELDEYEEDGLLTYLRCAFSRDQPHKVYIQDKISEDKELLADLLLQKNGHFYLCGPTWPVADVREALISSFISVGNMDRKQANATIETMRDQGRYVLEVY